MKQLFLIIGFICLGLLSNAASLIAQFDFYGHKENLYLPEAYQYIRLKSPSKNTISLTEGRIKNMPGSGIIAKQLALFQDKYNLDDAGLLLLAEMVCDKATQDDNMKVLLKYMAFKDLSYQTILSYTKSELICYAKMDFVPIRATYLILNNVKYYNTEYNNNALKGKQQIYGRKLLNAKPLVMEPEKLPNINKNQAKHKIDFNYGSKSYSIPVTVNVSYINYLSDLPRVSLGATYVKRELSKEAEISFTNSLKVYFQELKTEEQKLEFMLKLAQSLPYAKDADYHKTEHYSFPEETLSAPFSDCEDRVFLYAYLIKKFLNKKSLALYYKDQKHITLAFEGKLNNAEKTIEFQGKTYTCVDPTSPDFGLGQYPSVLKEHSKIYVL